MATRPGLDRDRVIEAAVELVAQGGSEQLSLARLAQRLGIKPPSLYNHVNGLEDLRRELRRRGLEELKARLERAVAGVAGRDALRALALAYRDFARERPGLYAFTLQGDEEDEEIERSGRELVATVLATLRGYGLVDEEALHATRCLRSALHGFVALEQAGGFALPLDLDHSFERLIDLLDHGLRGVFRSAATASPAGATDA